MAILEFALLLLACVLVSSVIDQFVSKLSLPLIQIALGVGIFIFTGGNYNFFADNNLFLVLFIAPLLFNEAQQIDKESLFRNPGAILSLAIGLVITVTLVIGFSLHTFVPLVPLTAAFALGAALGPTDAVAVSSLSDNIQLGKRQKGILQGECLINDASSIVAFQCAVVALTTGVFSAIDATMDFAQLFLGGIIVGIILGFIFNKIREWTRNLGVGNTTFQVLFELLLPFIAYFVAETLRVSGILAVVAAGVICSGIANKDNAKWVRPEISQQNIVSTSVWNVLMFALNGIVFIMLGAMLPQAMISTWENPAFDNFSVISYVLLITLILFVTRFIWLLIIEWVHNKKYNKKLFDKENLRSSLTMTIGGAKGAITMAIMFTIPAQLLSGAEFSGRQLLLFIAGGVIIFTLIIANFTLPLVMSKQEKLKIKEEEEMKEELAKSTIKILRNVIEDLNAMTTDENRTAIQNVINSYSDRIAAIKKAHSFDDKLNLEYRLKACEWEREFITQQINKNNITPLVARKYIKCINRKEDLLENHTSLLWKLRNIAMRSKHFVHHIPKKTKNIVQGEYAAPGETMKFSTQYITKLDKPIDNINDLRKATFSYVIKKIDNDIQTSKSKNEDMSNILNDYRKQLAALKEKSPSITALQIIEEQTLYYTRIGLDLELNYIQKEYDNKRLTREQYKIIRNKVLLAQVSLEKF